MRTMWCESGRWSLRRARHLPTTYTLDYVYVYVTPSRLTFMAESGQVEHVRGYGDGYVRYTAVGDGIRHQISNAGESLHRQILVELKAPHSSARTSDNGRGGELEAPTQPRGN